MAKKLRFISMEEAKKLANANAQEVQNKVG